jgi:hypothetical protein
MDMKQETMAFERETTALVQAACDVAMPNRRVEIEPYLFDAGVVVRHAPGEGPTLEDADRVADRLRDGRPLVADVADWHVSGFGPHCDALDPNLVYGTSFGLVRSFLPRAEPLERDRGRTRTP